MLQQNGIKTITVKLITIFCVELAIHMHRLCVEVLKGTKTYRRSAVTLQVYIWSVSNFSKDMDSLFLGHLRIIKTFKWDSFDNVCFVSHIFADSIHKSMKYTLVWGLWMIRDDSWMEDIELVSFCQIKRSWSRAKLELQATSLPPHLTVSSWAEHLSYLRRRTFFNNGLKFTQALLTK